MTAEEIRDVFGARLRNALEYDDLVTAITQVLIEMCAQVAELKTEIAAFNEKVVDLMSAMDA